MASSSSTSSDTSPWRYDVFLSFRGEDTRNTFTAHLYFALKRKGILTYLDENELRRGDEISPALLQAIEGSRIFIIVLSENYASSRWCLDELVKMLDQSKQSKQQRVLPVFYHVYPSDVRHQRDSFGKALAEHAEKLNVDHMKLQLWKAALQEVGNMSGYHLIRTGNESKFIEEIVQDVSRMANDHLYLPVADHPVGLKPHVEDVNLLLRVGTKDIRMIGIFGVGGIGKTTLAKAIYHSIASQFEARCFLPIDSAIWNQQNPLVQLQETLLSKIVGEGKSLKVESTDKGINMIKHRLHSTRVLLILDGVYHLDQLKTLAGARDWFGKGSRIIITARDERLLNYHGVDSKYQMWGLNYGDAFELFCWHAFGRNKPDDGYGKFVEQIVNYAQRLPLVLTVLGSYLNGRTKEEWESALYEYRKNPHQNIQKILQTSYDRLNDNERNVFLDIACFFNGQRLVDVIKILDSFDFYTNSCIPRLKEMCLISESHGILKMHDLVRDMGREVVRQESPQNPGARSRLFNHEDVRAVLEENTGTENVEAIVVDLPEGDDMIRVSSKALKKMKRLRLFICRNAQFSGELESLPNSIRVLDWPNCPLQSRPSKFRWKLSSVNLEKGASDTSTQNCCIYSVPKTLVEVIGKEWFEPQVVSIGHYNCKNGKHKHLQVNQDRKEEFCRYLRSHAKKSMEELMEIIHPEVEKIEFMPEKNDHEFLKMLVLDGCFILETFRIIGKGKNIKSDHPLAAVEGSIAKLYGDLLLLENQIPFVVLKKLFQTSKMRDEDDDDLSLLALRFFNRGAISRSDKDLKKMSEHLNDSLHLLDLFRRSFITPDLDQPPKEKKTVVPVIHCITKLLKARIEIKRIEAADSFLAVKFKNGVIEMPQITPDYFMKSFLVNCRAFEQLDNKSSKHITVYAYFLDCLVNTHWDVEHLYDRRIFDGSVLFGESSEVVQLINKLGKGINVKTDQFYLYTFFVKVDRRYKNEWKKHWTVFKRRYCNTPGSWISVFAAVVMLLLTILQTFYTVYGYYYPK